MVVESTRSSFNSCAHSGWIMVMERISDSIYSSATDSSSEMSRDDLEVTGGDENQARQLSVISIIALAWKSYGQIDWYLNIGR
jgi:hypothetical protein